MVPSKKIAIVGAGAAGCICAYHLLKAGLNVTLFDKSSPLRTLLPTGGGRCNLAHAEYDFKELAKNYPRGEKFLYSVFSRFSTSDTIEMFEEIGIKTYTQENGRIFPESNSAKDVRLAILNSIKKAKIIKKEITSFHDLKNFDTIIIATGGKSGYELAKEAGLNIINPKPSLVGLNTKEDFKELSGTVINDILFTHFGISGPYIYKISADKAFAEFPYELSFDLCPELTDLQEILNNNPQKNVSNILKGYMPLKIVNRILNEIFISPSSAHSGSFSRQGRSPKTHKQNEFCPPDRWIQNEGEIKAHQIDGKTRDLILEKIHNFKVTVTGTNKGEETVTAGGIDLDEINPKTMEAKKVPNLYCIGEVLNIDGYCGGFNLQNAWSTAYIAANAILQEE